METDTVWPFFWRHELECSCGCGEMAMDVEFMERLVALREYLDTPLVVTSGYRCPSYNSAVSTSGKTGPHTQGRAVDVHVSGRAAYRLIQAAMSLGFTGIGVQQKGEHRYRYIHIDTVKELRPWIWSY